MSGPEFRYGLAEQQCTYRTVNLKYPGNKQLNVYKKITKARNEARISALEHKGTESCE